MIRLSIADTGIGIAPEARERLFQSFSQADELHDLADGGTGLGLGISKRLVERMGGAIGVESVPGKGSTFWFTVRVARRPVPPTAKQVNLAALRRMRVLGVDDNATNRALLAGQLGAWGMHVECVADAFHALERLRMASRRPTYDLAILDHQMPDMDGMALARAIKSDPRRGGPARCLLTSVSYPGTAEERPHAGFSAFMLKPIRQSQLYDCIATVMGMSSEPAPSG